MELKDIGKILIINLGGLGDLLLSQPALRSLRDKYSGALIDIVVVEQAIEMAHESKLFNRIFVYKKDIFKTMDLLLSLRKNGYDLAVSMRTMVHRSSAIKMFLFLKIINARIIAGRDTRHMGFFYDIKIPETEPGEKYEMEYDRDTVKALGAECNERYISFELTEKSTETIITLLEENGVRRDDCLVGIHPGGMPSRRWPIENFRDLIGEIAQQIPCTFVITGGYEEKKLGDTLRGIPGKKIISLAGKLNLLELGALIKRCNVFISNDTGPMHIAAVLKTPLVALCGPGQLTRFDPRNISDKAVVLYKAAECAPCNKRDCSDLKCLRAISVHEAAAASLAILRAKE